MNKYVLGFAFSENRHSVLLMRKTHPEWQKGFLNGIGGKIEKGEGLFDAMNRECKEETGLTLDWVRKGIMTGISPHINLPFTCHIFYAYSQKIWEYKQIEDEPLGVYDPSFILCEKVIENLKFLVPFGKYGVAKFITLIY